MKNVTLESGCYQKTLEILTSEIKSIPSWQRPKQMSGILQTGSVSLQFRCLSSFRDVSSAFFHHHYERNKALSDIVSLLFFRSSQFYLHGAFYIIKNQAYSEQILQKLDMCF